MALFGLKKDTKEKEKAPKAAKTAAPKAAAKPRKKKAEVADAAPVSAQTGSGVAFEKTVVIRPHITEKATMMAESHVYTFEVARDANKIEVKKAVQKMYKVTPIAVRIVNTASRHERSGRTRRMIRRPGSKKAYVTLKKGEQISFV